MVDGSSIRERYAAVSRDLNERARRLFGAAEARTAGHGGITAASRATGLARSTIGRGLKDLDDPGSLVAKVRRPGSGRPPLTSKDTTLLEDLRQLLEPATMGDPMRPLRWVSKSHAKLAAALPRAVSGSGRLDDYGGWWRFQWLTGQAVQARTPEAG
jgi:hypothetical protein